MKFKRARAAHLRLGRLGERCAVQLLKHRNCLILAQDWRRNGGELDLVVLDGGTLGLDLLPHLEGVNRLIIVDAVEIGQPAGSCVRLAGDEVPMALETKLSPHQMGMKDLLPVARLMGHLPDEIVLIGVQPGSLEMDTELTPAVAAAMPTLLAMVQAELAAG